VVVFANAELELNFHLYTVESILFNLYDLKYVGLCSSEMLVSAYSSTRCYNPEGEHGIFTAMRTSNLITQTYFKSSKKIQVEI
jgi:hypothetical protein